MNVTDVDDKIIARARRGVVLQNYLKHGLESSSSSSSSSSSPSPPPSAAQVKKEASAALALALEKQEARLKRAQEAAKAEKGGKASGDGGAAAEGKEKTGKTETEATPSVLPPPPSLDRRLAKELAESVSVEELKTEQLRAASVKLAKASETDLREILNAAGDFLAEHLDRELGLGAAVTDAAVFREHASRYEGEFLRDMEALRVRPPSVLTRVSEYMEGKRKKGSFFFFLNFFLFVSFVNSFLFLTFFSPSFPNKHRRDRRLRLAHLRLRLRVHRREQLERSFEEQRREFGVRRSSSSSVPGRLL